MLQTFLWLLVLVVADDLSATAGSHVGSRPLAVSGGMAPCDAPIAADPQPDAVAIEGAGLRDEPDPGFPPAQDLGDPEALPRPELAAIRRDDLRRLPDSDPRRFIAQPGRATARAPPSLLVFV